MTASPGAQSLGTDQARTLRGRAAVAQAKLAYRSFRARFSGARWVSLADRGARIQRPLWASTSTKHPDYPDTLYVDNLIGPDTINTMPEHTIAAFEDHGSVARTVDEHVDHAVEVFDRLGDVGVDMADVARTLEEEGVAGSPSRTTGFWRGWGPRPRDWRVDEPGAKSWASLGLAAMPFG